MSARNVTTRTTLGNGFCLWACARFWPLRRQTTVKTLSLGFVVLTPFLCLAGKSGKARWMSERTKTLRM